jgi:alkylation response protein AidB-like acyl-CoA dehydrogenase
LRAVRETMERIVVAGRPLIANPTLASRLAQLEIETLGVETMVMRLMAEAAAGIDSGPRASMLKLRWSDLSQQILELWAETLGYEGALFESLDGQQMPLAPEMPQALQGAAYSRVFSIYGGSSEIQRNIVARRSLGL